MLSVVTKIVMQMNAKIGGQLWGLKIPMADVSSYKICLTSASAHYQI